MTAGCLCYRLPAVIGHDTSAGGEEEDETGEDDNIVFIFNIWFG